MERGFGVYKYLIALPLDCYQVVVLLLLLRYYLNVVYFFNVNIHTYYNVMAIWPLRYSLLPTNLLTKLTTKFKLTYLFRWSYKAIIYSSEQWCLRLPTDQSPIEVAMVACHGDNSESHLPIWGFSNWWFEAEPLWRQWYKMHG